MPQPSAPAVADRAQRTPGEVPYGQYYYRCYNHDNDTPYERNEEWLAFFGHIADRIARELRPSTVLDAGCAMGFLVEQLASRGVEAWGVDVSEYAIRQVDGSVADRCWAASLTEPLPRRYDMITCIEVIEHLDSDDGAKALANLCEATDRILFSSTPDDFAEPTHLHVQPAEGWSADFAVHGFYRNLDYDATYLSPWAALYERRTMLVPELVRTYDRSYYRLRREIREVRSTVLELQRRLEAAEEAGVRFDDDARSELLRVRDELAHLEVDAGRLRGENTELQARLAAAAPAAAQLDAVLSSTRWRATGKVLAPYHKVVAHLRRSMRS
jgi:SAM-dependent methyltransferase